MTEDYDPAAIRVLEGMDPPRPRGHVVEDLPEAERLALEVWRLGVRWKLLADAGDPGAVEAEAAYRKAEAEAVDAGHVMRRVDAADLRSRYPMLARDAEITIGVGWQPILENLLRRLVELSVTVRLVREKFGGLDTKIHPTPRWIGDEIDSVGQIREAAVEASLRTCEACGALGTLRRNGRGRTRCDAHGEM